MLKPNDAVLNKLLALKVTPMPLQEAIEVAEIGLERCRKLREFIEKKYQPKFEAKQKVVELSRNLIYNAIRDELTTTGLN